MNPKTQCIISVIALYALSVAIFFLDSYTSGVYSLIIAMLCTLSYKDKITILNYKKEITRLRNTFSEVTIGITALAKDNNDLKQLNKQLKQQIIELCPELAPRPRTRFKELPDGQPPPEDEKP
jgi:hypothetical protein